MSGTSAPIPAHVGNNSKTLRFTRQERRFLEMVHERPEGPFDLLAQRRGLGPLAADLRSERINCVQWLPLRTTDRVLEIGAGAGAITGGLANLAGHVTAIEPSPQRCHLNAIRCRDRRNVEIRCGTLTETGAPFAEGPYDWILLVGALDEADRHVVAGPNPQERLLRTAAERLAYGGWILVAGSSGTHPISRAEVERLAATGGFNVNSFYRVAPDLRFTRLILSDELAGPGEEDVARSRSWLAILSNLPDPPYQDSRVLSVRFATLRQPAYQLRTDLLIDSHGVKTIQKVPMQAEAAPHLASLAWKRDALTRLCAGSIFSVNQCEVSPEQARFEFIEGPTLADLAREDLRRGDWPPFLKRMDDFFGAIRTLATEEFRPTAEFGRMFGPVRLPGGLRSAPVSNVDLILPNVIVRDGRWHIIDYEWVFDFPVPVGFILYRTLRYLFLQDPQTMQNRKGLAGKLLKMAGIGPERRAYQRMELAFQRHVVPESADIQDWLDRQAAAGRAGWFNWLPWQALARLARAKGYLSTV